MACLSAIGQEIMICVRVRRFVLAFTACPVAVACGMPVASTPRDPTTSSSTSALPASSSVAVAGISTSGEAARTEPGIAHVCESRCAGCHVRIEPGERTRTELEAALARHRRRLQLSEGEWTRIVDYLSRLEDAGLPAD